MCRKIGKLAAVYATIYSVFNGWLDDYFLSATKSAASAFVCLLLTINLISFLYCLDSDLASSIISNWRNETFVALIILFAIVDFTVVETGKADRWAEEAASAYGFLKRFRKEISVGFIVITVVAFIWTF